MVEQGPAVLACDVALLDVNLGAGKPSGVDAYHWLRRSGYKGRICFLTGHARSHPDVSQVLSSDDAQLFVKPYEIDSLCAYVDGRPL